MRQFDQINSVCIDGYLFYKTCEAWPEQYDVYKGKKQVAYVRLRMGNLTARVPDVGGKLIYHKNYGEDSVKGYFDNDEERMEQLIEIVKILKREKKNVNKRKRNK